ncbi:PREDICTED: fanconi-associated nuclease 1-like isoform X1 [Polistes canadensis]|uniref:fanconi-associated nuclease 1-like isoform X1 n=1 Tax=Polistes canadensis TaxID=91411 RepID=UPI000718E926|nr:PREDICTED: fanconi-associated nuclease 1-like isoform X1 [Polistes canadensis]
MSTQTNLNQFFRKVSKGNRNVKSKDLVALKELKRPKEPSTKTISKTMSRKKSRLSMKRKRSSEMNELSFNNNDSIDNVQMTNISTHFVLDTNETYCTSDNLQDAKIDSLSDCSIIYEKINTSNNTISIDKEVEMVYGNHAIKDSEKSYIDSQLQEYQEQVSLCCNDIEFIKEVNLSEKESNESSSIKEASERMDIEYYDVNNGKSDLSVMSSSPVKSVPSPSKQRNLTFTPKKTSTKEVSSPSSKSPKKLNLYFRQIVNTDLTRTAIENMNLIKEGAIPGNNFNLQKIYASSSFTFRYNCVDTRVSEKYEYNDVAIPTETYAAHLFMIAVNVFSNPINCGYFDKEETDFIFSMLTLSIEAQILFARILKRKYSWHRVEHLKYQNLINDLTSICKELVLKSFFISDIENEDLSVSLTMLEADEVGAICKNFKLTKCNNKKKSIEKLLEIAAQKPLFPGMKTTGEKLKMLVSNKLGYCVRLSQKTIDIFDKILTLFKPDQKPEETLSDTFNMLLNIELGKICYPIYSDKRYPIFSDNNHLIQYIEAKHEMTNIINAIEKKKWESVRKIGKLAYDRWLIIMKSECASLKDCVLPSHLFLFRPGYFWLKILSKSIDSFKKDKDTLPFAIEILSTLINQNCYAQRKKESWYADLALIEMHHNKDLEASAKIILQSLKIETTSEVGIAVLVERAKILVKRKTGISKTTLMDINTTIQFIESKFPSPTLCSTTVEAALMKDLFGMNKRRSVWCIDNSTDNKLYSSVENVVLNSYYNQGFNGGVHCEGALPVTLFYALFWEELFNIDIPGTFVSLYQIAPLDLFTKDFYKNRKVAIDNKLNLLRSFDRESFSSLVEDNFILYSRFTSMMHVNMFTNNNIKEIVYCLGTECVLKICERLISNYILWKAGFPDLIVWNSNDKRCKIIEVKGPRDKLSVKQTLWLQYLQQIGVDTEVCLVKDNEHGKVRTS